MSRSKNRRRGEEKESPFPSPVKYSGKFEDYTENICAEAIEFLIKRGKLSEYKYSVEFDNVGIDFFLFKYVEAGKKIVRIAVPLQIKKAPSGARLHKSRYPNIPVHVVFSKNPKVVNVANAIWRLFCHQFKKSRYYCCLDQRHVFPN